MYFLYLYMSKVPTNVITKVVELASVLARRCGGRGFKRLKHWSCAKELRDHIRTLP